MQFFRNYKDIQNSKGWIKGILLRGTIFPSNSTIIYFEISIDQALERVGNNFDQAILIYSHSNQRPHGSIDAARRCTHVHYSDVKTAMVGHLMHLFCTGLKFGQQSVDVQVPLEAIAT